MNLVIWMLYCIVLVLCFVFAALFCAFLVRARRVGAVVMSGA